MLKDVSQFQSPRRHLEIELQLKCSKKANPFYLERVTFLFDKLLQGLNLYINLLQLELVIQFKLVIIRYTPVQHISAT